MGRMHYQVWAGDSLLADQQRPAYRMKTGKLKTKVSNAGSLSLKLEAMNPTVDKIELMHTQITVTRDEEPIWKGRCSQIERDSYWVPSITCDGGLSYLQDSLLDPMTLSGTPHEVMTQILTAHNRMCGIQQRFSLKDLAMDLGWANIETKSWTSAWSMIQTMLKTYGGYIISGVNYGGHDNAISWSENMSVRGEQAVVWGVNMTSFTRRLVGKDIYTGLIPTSEYTATEDNKEVKKTLDLTNYSGYGYTRTDLNDPRMHIAASNDMRIYRQKQFDINGSADASVLAAHAELDLLKNSQVFVEWDVRATDRSHVQSDVTPFELGKSYRALVPIYGIDEWLPMTEIDLDLVTPQKSSYMLGGTRPFISRMLHAN